MSRQLFIGIILFCSVVLLLELVKKNIVAAPYYRLLSQTNAIRKVTVPAPRGVFYDRNGVLLAKNQESKETTSKREYPLKELFAHTIGYMSLPGERSIKDIACGSKALPTQPVGVYGLERAFECRLRGKPGSSFIRTNATGEGMQTYAIDRPKQGESIKLTFSSILQEKAARALEGKKGAIIASHPKTGELYILYSSPSFDPNKLMWKSGAYGDYENNKDKPLFNRVTSGLYPPGSVIKPALALFALHEGVVTPQEEIEDTGIFELGGVKFGNWYFLQYGKKEGMVNVEKAIARSNDIYFYTLGVKAGIDKLSRWLHRMRFDERDLSPFFPQLKGIVPSTSWKQDALGEQWYLGDTVNLSIGQGFTQVSPAQIHAAMSIIANKGVWCPFQVEKGEKGTCIPIATQTDEWEPVLSGMVKACSKGGTGWPLFDYAAKGKKISVACKTGTAESQQRSTEPHAWFSAFAPAENPEILVTVLVENGGEGSSVAAPIAKQILDAFFAQ